MTVRLETQSDLDDAVSALVKQDSRLKPILARTGHVLVDRKNPGPDIVQKMARLVREGSSLIVFPEGTRSVDGSLGRFKWFVSKLHNHGVLRSAYVTSASNMSWACNSPARKSRIVCSGSGSR